MFTSLYSAVRIWLREWIYMCLVNDVNDVGTYVRFRKPPELISLCWRLRDLNHWTRFVNLYWYWINSVLVTKVETHHMTEYVLSELKIRITSFKKLALWGFLFCMNSHNYIRYSIHDLVPITAYDVRRATFYPVKVPVRKITSKTVKNWKSCVGSIPKHVI